MAPITEKDLADLPVIDAGIADLEHKREKDRAAKSGQADENQKKNEAKSRKRRSLETPRIRAGERQRQSFVTADALVSTKTNQLKAPDTSAAEMRNVMAGIVDQPAEDEEPIVENVIKNRPLSSIRYHPRQYEAVDQQLPHFKELRWCFVTKSR
jgi:hypothetical protein